MITSLTSTLLALLLLLVLLNPALSQSTTNQITWAAISYTYHGEKTPSFHPPSSSPTSNKNLTPLGATQLFAAGTGLRNRYVTAMNISQDTVPIWGIGVDRLDGGMVDVVAVDNPWVAASALAFMQGLYPPFEGDGTGEGDEVLKGEGGLYGFPLNGYQYPRIATLSELDFNYIWIAGQADCEEYSNAQAKAIGSPAYVNKIRDTQTYYSSFTNEVFPDRDQSTINYANALEVYQSALYAYKHNSTIHKSTTFTTDDLAILRSLASEQQWTFNTPMGDNLIPAISGRTLAAEILQRLNAVVISKGRTPKLSLMFGGVEPFMAFFALASLATGPSGPQFNTLPDHGSTMTFELFSTQSSSSSSSTSDQNGDTSVGSGSSSIMPSPDQLSIRFLFRNGSEPEAALKAYTLFGRGNSETVIPWLEFKKMMGDIAMTDVLDWCRACGTATLFCEAFESIAGDGGGDGDVQKGDSPSGNSGRGNGISSTVGGVIGAAVAVAVFLVLLLGLLGAGFRVERRKRERRDLGDISVLKRGSSGSGNGNAGFKGADRLGSDTDLTFKGGAGATVVRHERVGSWELGESPVGGDSKHASLDKEIESGLGGNGRVVSGADYGKRSRELDRENPFVDPVTAVERV